jgi:NADH-quinone oxidoreductase subunit F
MIALGNGLPEDLDHLEKISQTMMDASFCPLGQTAPSVLSQALKKYHQEFIEHIHNNNCPAGVCNMNFTEED